MTPPGLRLRATLLGAFLVSIAVAGARAADEAPPSLGPDVTVGRLSAGGTSIVSPTHGAPIAAVELWYRAPSTGFNASPEPAIARLAAQAVAASKPIVGDSLGSVVRAAGGRLSISVYADSIAISATVPAGAARKVVKAATTAFFAPVLTEDGYRSALADVELESEFSAFDPETVARDAVFGQLFTSGPEHYPVLGDPKTVAQIGFNDVRSYATRAFRSQNATLVVSGTVDADVAAAAVAGRPDDASVAPEAHAPAPVAATTSPLDKAFGEDGGGYGWIGPSIADAREATAMDFIADYLFRTDAGVVSRAADAKDPEASVVGQFITLHDPGVMFVAYSGSDAVALRSLVDDGFTRIKTPLEPAPFAAALRAFKYHLLSDLQTPTEVADNYGWYSVEGNVEYAPGANGDAGTYFKTADSLTPAFVAAVATKYFDVAPATVSLHPPAPDVKKVKS